MRLIKLRQSRIIQMRDWFLGFIMDIPTALW